MAAEKAEIQRRMMVDKKAADVKKVNDTKSTKSAKASLSTSGWSYTPNDQKTGVQIYEWFRVFDIRYSCVKDDFTSGVFNTLAAAEHAVRRDTIDWINDQLDDHWCQVQYDWEVLRKTKPELDTPSFKFIPDLPTVVNDMRDRKLVLNETVAHSDDDLESIAISLTDFEIHWEIREMNAPTDAPTDKPRRSSTRQPEHQRPHRARDARSLSPAKRPLGPK